MPSYYNEVYGDLYPGQEAKSEDIMQIQQHIQDMIRDALDDQYHHTSYILGDKENDFLLSPAPKRSGRYIDQMNVFGSSQEVWLDINEMGYKQAIKKTKTSTYSFIVKLRNTFKDDQPVLFELWTEDNKVLQQTVIIPARTQSSEFEIVFDLDHIATKMGRDSSELEKPDAIDVAHPGEENLTPIQNENPEDPNNMSLGSTQIYLVVKAIHKATKTSIQGTTVNTDEEITSETFMILADNTGSYGHLLQKTGDDGRNYETTDYDLYFKDIYANAPTYLCTGGEAIVSGEKVISNDSHVSVDGASAGGNTKTYVTMDQNGFLQTYTSEPYWGDDDKQIVEVPGDELVIAIIYTYNGDIKQPKIIQDDTRTHMPLHEITRPRSHHERLRRIEKELLYQRDISIPSRLKYNLTGEDIVDSDTLSDKAMMQVTNINTDNIINGISIDSTTNNTLDWSKYFVSTDMYGNYVIKSVNAETVSIPVTLKETRTLDGKTGIDLAKTIVSANNINVDSKNGIVELAEHKVTTTKTEQVAKYQIATTAKEAKETTFNPWDDSASNRPSSGGIKPKIREFVMKKNVNGKNVRSSSYPAMTLYLKEPMTITELQIPVVKFKNTESVQFHIFERQGPNNKTNEVWLKERVYSSPKYSLKNAKEKNGYQILEEPIKIKPKGGLKLKNKQYVILVKIVPKSSEGSVYTETYKPDNPRDFLIRYNGSSDCNHFRLGARYHEIWYTSGTKKATVKGTTNEYYKTGTIESGEVVWENSEPITSITANINSTGNTIKLYANAGNGWVSLTNGKATPITGGTTSFKWKAELSGNGKSTPKIKYDKDKGYAILFSITKREPSVNTYDESADTEGNKVITTKTFYPGDILAKYIGDDSLVTCNKFSNYEWLRIWGTESGNSKAVIDIAGSDKRLKFNVTEGSNTVTVKDTISSDSCAPDSDMYDVFTYYYADLTFDDFARTSVDYSNYDDNIEYDEYNLRMKIDTDRAYNDDDIQLFDADDWTYAIDDFNEEQVTIQTDGNESVMTDTNSLVTAKRDMDKVTFHFNQTGTAFENTDNTLICKNSLKNGKTIDLTKYTALKIGYDQINTTLDSEKDVSVSGLGLYISSAIEEECPSNNNDNGLEIDNKTIEEFEQISPATLTEEEMESYKNKILKVERTINNVKYTEYYYYTPDENGVWTRRQLHNLKTFTIYELPKFALDNLVDSTNSENVVDEEDKYFTISIDSENDYFKYVREIGIIALNNEEKDQKLNVVNQSDIQFTSVKGIVQGYNVIYDASKNITLEDQSNANIEGKYVTSLFRDQSGQVSSLTRVYYNLLDGNKNERIAYINNETFTHDANHLSIQFATDTFLPKNCLMIDLCSKENGIDPIFSLNMPTFNQVYYDAGLQLQDIFNKSYTNTINTVTNGTDQNDFGTKMTKSDYNIEPEIDKAENNLTDAEKKARTEYKVYIEPKRMAIRSGENLEFNLYQAKKTTTNGKTTYGTKTKLKKCTVKKIDEDTTTQNNPAYQDVTKFPNEIYVMIEGVKTAGESTNQTQVFKLKLNKTADSTYSNFKVPFNYTPGNYKVTIGVRGVKNIYDEEQKKVYSYIKASKTFNLNIYQDIQNVVNFNTVYKKINETQDIKSIAIRATPKFKKYMNSIRGTTESTQRNNQNGAKPFMHFFIKNIVLHEAEYIPLVHPNMRMKIYSDIKDSNDSDSAGGVNIRKVGAVIEYK